MEKFTSIVERKDDQLIIEAIDPQLTTLFKKFDYSDLMVYVKGLMVKYLDMYLVKKLLPKLDEPETYNDYMYVFNKIDGHLNQLETKNFKEAKKLIKKKYNKEKLTKNTEEDGEEV